MDWVEPKRILILNLRWVSVFSFLRMLFQPSSTLPPTSLAMDTTDKKSLEEEKPISNHAPTFHVLATEVTEKDRQKLYRKIDWHILPYVSLLYFLSFLWVWRSSFETISDSTVHKRDRSNIGIPRLISAFVPALKLYFYVARQCENCGDGSGCQVDGLEI